MCSNLICCAITESHWWRKGTCLTDNGHRCWVVAALGRLLLGYLILMNGRSSLVCCCWCLPETIYLKLFRSTLELGTEWDPHQFVVAFATTLLTGFIQKLTGKVSSQLRFDLKNYSWVVSAPYKFTSYVKGSLASKASFSIEERFYTSYLKCSLLLNISLSFVNNLF